MVPPGGQHVAAQQPPPTAALAGLQVHENRPKAQIQRRLYAQDDIPQDISDRQREPSQPTYQPAAAARGGAQPGAHQSNGSTAAPSSSRIDPAQIPRPDASRPAETWPTRANIGQCPPAATSAFLVEDEGNCSPRFMRLTLNQVHTTSEGLASSGAPFAAVIQPLADIPAAEGTVPVTDFGEDGPIRCERCRAYVNPFFAFSNGGRSFTCNLCNQVNTTPSHYFCEIDHNGYRRDHNERPELCRGVVEFVAPSEYQARPPKPPPIVCLVEASYASINNGFFQASVDALRRIIPSLPPYTQLAVVTFDEAVHFYRQTELGLQQMTVPDATQVCLPLPPSSLFANVGDSLDQIDQLLTSLPALVAHTRKPDTALGSALQAGFQLLEGTGGRLLFFQHVLPVGGPMKLQQRDDTRLYGTDKERALFAPLDSSWEALAKQMATAQISVSSFHFTIHGYVDVASQSIFARHTGGQAYLYTECTPEQRDVWTMRLEAELGRNLRRTFGFEGVMRVRCSKGLCVDEYLMGTPRPGEAEVDVPGIDADSAFAVKLKHDDKLDDGAPAYLQCALLYTTSAGQRRVRVLTLALLATEAMASLYRYADLDVLLNVMMRQAVLSSAKQNLHLVREGVVNTTVNMLHTYRKMCASASTASGQLILPESLKLLPLYALSLTKNALLRPGTDVRVDERSALMAMAVRMPVTHSVAFIYPRLYPLKELSESVGSLDVDGTPHLPPAGPLAYEKLEQDGAYLLDNATGLYLWVGRNTPQEFLQSTLQVPSLEGIESSRLRVPLLENETSVRVNRLVNAIRSQRPHLLQCARILGPKDPLEGRFIAMLTEDRAQTTMSYVEFLCHVHRQIQQKMT